MPKYSVLYLLIRKDFLNEGKNIYKIGKSTDIYSRVYNYPKSSHLYLLILSDMIDNHERALIKHFTNKFTIERNYGKEYFSGNINDMINEMILYMQNNITKYCVIEFRDGMELTTCVENNNATKTLNKYLQNIIYTDNVHINDNITINANANANANITINAYSYKCPCGKGFPHYYLLLRHQSGIRGCSYTKSLTNQVEENDDNSTCDICNKTLSDKYTLKRHKDTCSKKLEQKAQADESLDTQLAVFISLLNNILNKLPETNHIDLFNLILFYDNERKELI